MLKYSGHVPMALFALYFLKVTLFPISYPEAMVLGVLGLTASYFQYKRNDQSIKDLEAKFEIAVKTFEYRTQDIQQLKDQINGIKLTSLSRPISR